MQPLAVAVAVLLAANGLLHMALLADPLQTTSLILLLVGAGILILSQRWFAVVVLATVGGWVAVASRLPSSPDLAHFGFALMMGAVLALLVQHVHRGHLFRVETLRLRDEERRIELEEAHRTLERRVDDRTRQLREVNSSLQREMAERHEAEEKLRQAHRMEAVGRVAGAVAHDFNNLLTIISGHAELLLQDFAPHDERRLDVDEIREAAGRAARLTRHLLAFGGRQLLRPALLDVNEVARTVLHRTAEDRDPSIRCELDLALDLPPVFVDRGQLEQILLHLLTNAREAMPLGGTLTVATRRREAAPRAGQPAEGGYVLVEVRDTGEGMDPLTQALAFEPFFTTRDPATHHGLGLSFVFGTVRQSGGFVEVDSAPGQGTVFTLWLPEHSPVAGAETPPPPWLRDEDPSSDTVLLVEDETGVRMLASHVLAREGYRVIEAASAEEGLARFEESSAEICLLVSDVVLPGMTGPQLAERVLARRPELPVLFISGYTGEMVLGPRDLGEGRAFLQKPFSVEALLLRVSELLRTRSA